MTDATTSRTDRPRILLYVQHLLGIGHQKRAATLTRALEAAGFAVTYVSGGFPVRGLDTGPADFVQLPPARATAGTCPCRRQPPPATAAAGLPGPHFLLEDKGKYRRM